MDQCPQWPVYLALVMVLASAQGWGAAVYSITDLGTLGGLTSYARAINNLRQVVGQSNVNASVVHAFLWSNGVMSDLGTLGGTCSFARDINNGGVIVGESGNSSNNIRGFIYQNGTMTTLGTLGGTESTATGINDNGVVCGWSAKSGATNNRAFRTAVGS